MGNAIFYGLTAVGIVTMWIASAVLSSWMLFWVAVLMSIVYEYCLAVDGYGY